MTGVEGDRMLFNSCILEFGCPLGDGLCIGIVSAFRASARRESFTYP
jgi:hypothetical protein